MKIKHLAKIEISELDSLCASFRQEVEETISQIKGEKFRFYILPKNEQYRLLRLKVWREYYQVDLLYILSKLLPFWKAWIPKKSKSIVKGEGLGVRIATLTGKKSQQILEDFIKQDFPSEQNKILWRSHKQSILLDREDTEDGIKTKSDRTKHIFDFPNPKGYVQYYRRHIRRSADRREKMVEEFKKRPYRGNPFVEGL